MVIDDYNDLKESNVFTAKAVPIPQADVSVTATSTSCQFFGGLNLPLCQCPDSRGFRVYFRDNPSAHPSVRFYPLSIFLFFLECHTHLPHINI